MGLLIAYLQKLKPNKTKSQDKRFVNEVFNTLEEKSLVVLFSQDFTNIDVYFNNIKKLAKERFENECYMVSVPSFISDEHRYVRCIADDCGIECEVKELQDWKEMMRKHLSEINRPLLLLITDIENGDEVLDRKFSTLIRNFKIEFPHFHALLIGRKALAKLVYAQGELSPLNIATEMFFPENNQKLGEERIVQQFSMVVTENQSRLCRLLQKERVGRFVVWSNNELINQLFWNNLLVKQGKYFEWRGELTKELGCEILECESNNE